MSDSGFTVDVDQNQYLPEGGRDVSAVVTVTSGPDAAVAAPGDAGSAEIIISDCSGSMDYPPTKMSQARAATAAAIDVIRDGVGFAVVAGTSTSWPVFPPDGTMAVASPQSRAAARQARAAQLTSTVMTALFTTAHLHRHLPAGDSISSGARHGAVGSPRLPGLGAAAVRAADRCRHGSVEHEPAFARVHGLVLHAADLAPAPLDGTALVGQRRRGRRAAACNTRRLPLAVASDPVDAALCSSKHCYWPGTATLAKGFAPKP